ncbi:augmin complex subunit dgt5 [Musca vetustissima]|uniref:augmin complex subunit dgt5 n=1 Tax=Musca vetustissima TaxID=27455 RepID=UPI002AB60B33|nr:augmin complex subunit dgt5 [Musca vetustissima]
MTIEDDMEAFRVWATKLGCPPEAMPSEDALKSVFKSRQRDVFCNLMRRVRPRQDVKDIKENILIHKVEKIRGQVLSVCERSFLPHELQMHLKIQDKRKKLKDLEQRLDERKKEFEAQAASIKTKNIQIANMENKCDLLEARVHLLDFKSKALDKNIKREEDNREKIKATMPVVLTHENKSEQKANEAVLKALKELEDFYTFCEQNNNYQILQDAKTQLWAKMRQIFANIPNFLIFNTINRLKEEQLHNIMSLNKTINNDSHLTGNSRDPLTNFEINFMKAKSSFLGIVGRYLTACQERKNLEMEFPKTYEDFEDKLLEKVKIFSTDLDSEHSEEIMRNYVVEYNFLNFTKGENEYLTQQIDLLKAELETAQKYLENHEVLLGSIKQVYGEISASVNKLQYDMMQLSQIKDKIIYSKNIMKHQLDDLEAMMANNNTMIKSNFKPTKLKITHNNNMSLVGADSFEMSNDNVFCSTKLDFDSTISSLNNTTLRRSFGGGGSGDITLMSPQAQNTVLPSHSLELATFCETPLEHISCLRKESLFYLAPNPLITETSELSSTVQLAPGVLLTPFGALQEVRNRILWADLIAQHSNDLKLNLDTFFVDPQQYKQKAKQQHDRIIEVLDKIDVCSVNTLHSLQKLAKFYDFLIENPLRHFIPPTKTFNNQTYADYEGELTMYIRIATTGNSIK